MQWHDVWQRILQMPIPLKVGYGIMLVAMCTNTRAIIHSTKSNVRRGMYWWHLVLSTFLFLLGVLIVLGILNPVKGASLYLWIYPTLLISLVLPAQIHLWRTKFIDEAIRNKVKERIEE